MSTAPVRRPIGGNIWRTGVALAAAFATLAVGAGWWQVVDAQRLSREPDNPAVIAVARRALRGPIVDRDGRWLARSTRDANGEAVREYRDDSISHVVGYASRQYGTAGLERAYNAELIGLGGSDPFAGLLDKFDASRRSPLGLQTTLDLRLQHAAIEGLGADHGAVVMLDPSTGDVLALASTPTYDAAAIADPDTAGEAFAALRDDESDPLLPRATMGRYVPGSVFKIVTAIAGLNTGSIAPDTTFPQQPKAEDKGLLVEGFRIKDGHHPQTGNTPLDFTAATEVSCNIWFALAGLATGGDDLVSQADLLGFGAPIPFDLPTAVSRVTDGERVGAGRLQRRRRARVGVVRPGRDVRHAAADGARGVDRRERRRPDAPAAGQRPDRRGRGRALDLALDVATRDGRADAQSVQTAMQAAVEGDLGQEFTAGAAVPGVPTAGKSGTAELGGIGRATLLVHRLRTGRQPEGRDRRARRAGRPRRRARRAARRIAAPALLRPVRCSLMTDQPGPMTVRAR